MDDLISRSELMQAIKRQYCTDCDNYEGLRCRACHADDMMALVDDAPTIDAEPVVRCKDCKHFMFGDYCMHDGVMEHSHARENDFCSYGERRAADADEDEIE